MIDAQTEQFLRLIQLPTVAIAVPRDVPRRDIATEELSHLEMIGQILVGLLKGTPGAMIDEVEGGYLGELVEGNGNTISSSSWRGTRHSRFWAARVPA